MDNGRCDGCGECAKTCPASLFEVAKDEQGQAKARIREGSRKKLAQLCPGFKDCAKTRTVNCHSACPKDALSHTW